MTILRRYICVLLMLALLVTQYGLARHAAVHFFEDGGTSVLPSCLMQKPADAHHDDGGTPHCDLCEFAKMLGHAAAQPMPALLPPLLLALALLLWLQPLALQLAYRPYAARASPAAR